MDIGERRTAGDRRSSKDRPSGVDKRSEEEERQVGERRSNIDRRSGVDRRFPVADTSDHDQGAKQATPKYQYPAKATSPSTRFLGVNKYESATVVIFQLQLKGLIG
jgi:hypothetical protein